MATSCKMGLTTPNGTCDEPDDRKWRLLISRSAGAGPPYGKPAPADCRSLLHDPRVDILEHDRQRGAGY